MPLRSRRTTGTLPSLDQPRRAWFNILVLLVYTITMFTSAALLFLGAASVCPDDPAAARRLASGMEHDGCVLSDHPAGRLCLCPRYSQPGCSRRRQIALQVALLLASFAALPIAIPGGWSPPAEANPIPWLLALLLVAVGAPFFIVSTSSPLLQSWFASTSHRAARDPYFLYAASNAGSMLALIKLPVADRAEAAPQRAKPALGQRLCPAAAADIGLRGVLSGSPPAIDQPIAAGDAHPMVIPSLRSCR